MDVRSHLSLDLVKKQTKQKISKILLTIINPYSSHILIFLHIHSHTHTQPASGLAVTELRLEPNSEIAIVFDCGWSRQSHDPVA